MRFRPLAVLGLAAGILLAGFIGIIAWLFFGPEIQERLQRRKFDAVEWRSADPSRTNTRTRMVDDLLRSGQLKGKSRAEVMALLGQPRPVPGYFERSDLVYRVGPERGFISIDSEWLVLQFDRSSNVVGVKIVTD